MGVNQSQVDHIITAASEDDPEVKLQNLEREVDLIKTSIKRLLMDIRERMNELENPFTLVTNAPAGAQTGIPAEVLVEQEARKTALEAREAELNARESRMEAAKVHGETENNKESPHKKESPVRTNEPALSSVDDSKRLLDEQMLAVLRSQIVPQKPIGLSLPVTEQTGKKIQLQKVYKLFKWTQQAVKKFGHDRLEIILESYKAMGYITKESCDEVREISRLMPANLGEEHEVGPDEYVSELYELNRILCPDDTSLDRDMIEVMMEKRQSIPVIASRSSEERIDLSRIAISERKSSMKKEKDEEWMNLPDRI